MSQILENEKLLQIMEITGMDESSAKTTLLSSNGEIDKAIENYFSTMDINETSPVPPSTTLTQHSTTFDSNEDSIFNIEKLDDRTWKIVEDDRFKQYPFIYVIKGTTKIAIIDTGCGSGNLKEFIKKSIQTDDLPFILICTHTHFDHIGANYEFDDATEIYLGSRDKKFSQNYELFAKSNVNNVQVKTFNITHWLDDNDVIYLDDEKKMPLQIIHTPGHTPDSISIFDKCANRIFVGDLLYRYTQVSINHPTDFVLSLRSLLSAIESAPDPELISFACGHVDANLLSAKTQINTLLSVLEMIRENAITPVYVNKEDKVAEYAVDQYTLLLPLTWQ